MKNRESFIKLLLLAVIGAVSSLNAGHRQGLSLPI